MAGSALVSPNWLHPGGSLNVGLAAEAPEADGEQGDPDQRPTFPRELLGIVQDFVELFPDGSHLSDLVPQAGDETRRMAVEGQNREFRKLRSGGACARTVRGRAG